MFSVNSQTKLSYSRYFGADLRVLTLVLGPNNMTLATCRVLVGLKWHIMWCILSQQAEGHQAWLHSILMRFVCMCTGFTRLKLACHALDPTRAIRYSAGISVRLPACVLPSLLRIICMP